MLVWERLPLTQRRHKLRGASYDLWVTKVDGVAQDVQETEPGLRQAVVVKLGWNDAGFLLTYLGKDDVKVR